MAMSKARKAREKLAKQGRLTPDLLRGSWHGVNPLTRQSETLKEKQTKLQSKHKRNHAHYSDDSFCFSRRARTTANSLVPLRGNRTVG
ncbi:hypothetical protein [Paenibacillus harenae]|uniref:hypothetical protein n=1 Tax=Paenibacillus harenae TaxID=306543 RepID=UPI0027912603|nr:hypothetical protein [Paenibacillus harenae]MDQ0058490.1 hypothetical protein [Paenibacillus harenae]